MRTARPHMGERFRLVFLSFLMLFVELALIRWTAANNIHLAYIRNFVLLASFLGIGIGFLHAGSDRTWFSWAPVALALIVAFVFAFPVALTVLTGPHQLVGRFGIAPLRRPISLGAIFLLSVAVMAALADGVARVFVRFPPLEAYRLDVIGSIGGIVAFSLLSFLRLPPLAWGLVACLSLVVLLGRRLRWWQLGAAAVVIALLASASFAPHDHWSPYYKVTAMQPPHTRGVLTVFANNIPHQTAFPITTLHRIERFYFFPYRHTRRRLLRNVLIVGAGTGNDVAVALAEGAGHVDAVEIDPVLQQLGRRYHPNHPYQSSRVSVYIADGRAYLENTSRLYDLIEFALPDSLTLLPGQGTLRLENYLFTVEAMRTARAHLKPDGVFTMYNYYEPFLLARYAGLLRIVYGRAPCLEVGDRLGGRRQAVLSISARGPVARCARRSPGVTADPPTDDHPFPYLASRSIPSVYLWTLGAVLALTFVLVRLFAGPLRSMRRHLDLALMGGAFLLLETKNVVQFALLFGTTWLVNSLVFVGVLLSVLAAIETARRLRLPRPAVLYAALLVALAIAWLVPQERLLGLPPVARFVAAVAVAFTPIFIANLVFAQRFRADDASRVAFGANLLGAMIGGALEYLALLTGYRFLLVVVAALYGLAFIFRARSLSVLGAPA